MDIRFTITNPEYYEQELIKAYEIITDRTLYPADPERLVLDVIAYISSLLAFKIDWSAKQNLLAYAEGRYLDKLAEFYGVQRLPAQKARTRLKFYLQSPTDNPVLIPKGTRAKGGDFIFETIEEVVLPPGQAFVEVDAECKTPGAKANGLSPGQINQLLDPLPYGIKVTNTSTSMYGTDEEDDERFRERIRLSIERFSNAGSRQAYIYHTKTAHVLVEDVQVISPAPGQVHVYFLLKDGQLPDSQMIELVRKHLNDEKVRPLTDQVFVLVPRVVSYTVNIRYWIHKKDEAKVFFIQQAVQKAVEEFIKDTGRKIGKDVLPEELIQRVKNAGAYKVEVLSPQRIEISAGYVAKGEIQSVQYAGPSDD
ncbi:MAG: baseplate J/gp47 family protein [Hydrogenobacter thermophilus]|uniref:baseplate assembly protein n=1 Tax=Hydrogenobacter thermophilus TaxID=940 RepID=UPI001C7745B4|nr:baseplate J/gp47 family protein [Hydrogenobacter thermophilus]QWK20427.1 MAG: baseplate J/gp47 family protein [Hydrogenobacter thermophilus]